MANRFEDERGGGRLQENDDDFPNRGRSEWDDDHGNGSGQGRAYGRPRFDEDNGYIRQGGAPNRSRLDEGDASGWRGLRPNGAPRDYTSGFGGGSLGYAANRDWRRDQGRDEGNYGGANLRFTERGPEADHDDPSSGYGSYSDNWAETGRMAGGPMSHHDQDYYHWRAEQMAKLDRDYAEWRRERASKFSDEFEKWRAGRPQNPNDETLANANPRNEDSQNATGSSPSGSSRHK